MRRRISDKFEVILNGDVIHVGRSIYVVDGKRLSIYTYDGREAAESYRIPTQVPITCMCDEHDVVCVGGNSVYVLNKKGVKLRRVASTRQVRSIVYHPFRDTYIAHYAHGPYVAEYDRLWI